MSLRYSFVFAAPCTVGGVICALFPMGCRTSGCPAPHNRRRGYPVVRSSPRIRGESKCCKDCVQLTGETSKTALSRFASSQLGLSANIWSSSAVLRASIAASRTARCPFSSPDSATSASYSPEKAGRICFRQFHFDLTR